MTFRAPVQDLLFNIKHVANIGQLTQIPAFADAGFDTAQAVLEECAKFNEQVVAPLNWTGDTNPSTCKDGVVTTTPGFAQAYKQFTEGGWQGLQHPAEYDGQGLPKLIGAACTEILHAANLSFALCPMLTDGAIEAMLTASSDTQKATYLSKLVTGEWTGTMNLTEPQAGSDLAAVRSKAVPQGDGTYRISGQKIYITYGEHDMADNIVHLVLARTPDAPAGVKGISLFIVPKFLVNADGSLGARNDVYCASIEHKLGIKASPTAVLVFGDNKGAVGEGAIGTLVGEENRGLEYMFIMMNSARFGVGVQGIAIAERAYQKAVGYARDRVQSRSVDGSPVGSPIIHHPDVRRMLMTMRAQVEGCRAMALTGGAAYDAAHHHPDAATRAENQAFYEFMVPLIKGYSTEMSLDVTSTGVQVHGGMGFIEETGAAQYYRDAKILTIYEGTTAIQANDLVGRKTVRDGGALAQAIAAQIAVTEAELIAQGSASAISIAVGLAAARAAFLDSVAFIAAQGKTAPAAAYAGSVPYLMLSGNLMAGWQLARGALAALSLPTGTAEHSAEFMAAKITTAQFYAQHILPKTAAQRDAIVNGSTSLLGLDLAAF
jgi:3-(methylthio)propanoyl-CoA dehydrogenase